MVRIDKHHTQDIRQATVFLVNDCKHVPAKAYFAAVCAGGWILSESVLANKGGLVTKYSYPEFEKLCRGFRGLYVTAAFKNQHAGLTLMLRWGVAEGFWAAIEAASVDKKTICLVGDQDAETQTLKRRAKQCFSKDQFIRFLTCGCKDNKLSCRVES